MAVKADGTVYAWGQGLRGTSDAIAQLGTAVAGTSLRKLDITGSTTSAGVFSAFVLGSGGVVKGWGAVAEVGGIENSTGMSFASPVTSAFPGGITDITHGTMRGMALHQDGTVWYSRAVITDQSAGSVAQQAWTLLQIPGLDSVRTLIGVSHFADTEMAIKTDGSLWHIRFDSTPRFGIGQRSYGASVRQQPGLPKVRSARCSNAFCMAVAEDHSLWYWRANAAASQTAPASLPGVANIAEVWITFLDDVYAIDTNGQVWDLTAATAAALAGSSAAAEAIPGLNDVIEMSDALGNTLVRRKDGTVWGWGNNGNGELGDGTTRAALRTAPVQVKGLNLN